MPKSYVYPADVRKKVLRRDKLRCVVCGSRGVHVHEIVPRSRFGKLRKHICFSEKNMVSLCVECHRKAHNEEWRIDLIRVLSEKYGYTYEEPEFRRYVNVEG